MEQRIGFFNRVVAGHPTPTKQDNALWSINGTSKLRGNSIVSVSATEEPAKPQNKKDRDRPTTRERKPLIPSSFRLNGLPEGKINDVYGELKKLEVKRFRHAVAILFRSFLEYSLKHYIAEKEISVNSQKLTEKLHTVRKYMSDNEIMKDHELKPIDIIISSQSDFFSTHTLNAYVHDTRFSPDADELKYSWNNLQHFFEVLWKK